jgi:hypothetical protein
MPLTKPLPGSLWRPSGGIPQPIGAWLLNEGAGLQAWDASGNGNHGTLSGFAASQWGVVGESGGLTTSTNGSNVISLPATALDFIAGPFSIIARVRVGVNAGAVAVTGHIIGIRSAAGYQWQYRFSAGKQSLLRGSGSDPGTATLTAGTWYTLGVCVKPDGTGEFYIDGTPDGALATRTITDRAIVPSIGDTIDNSDDWCWNGGISWVMAWPTYLTDSNVYAVTADPFASWRPDKRWWYAAAGGAGPSYKFPLPLLKSGQVRSL